MAELNNLPSTTQNRVSVNGTEIWLDELGIIHTVMQVGMNITLEDAQANLQVGLEVSGRKKRPILVDLRMIKSMERAARSFYAGSNTTRIEKAVAILIDSPISKVIGNFFIGLNRSDVPTRLFTSEEKALEWLKEYCE